MRLFEMKYKIKKFVNLEILKVFFKFTKKNLLIFEEKIEENFKNLLYFLKYSKLQH